MMTTKRNNVMKEKRRSSFMAENNIGQTIENNNKYASLINQYVTINGNSPEKSQGVLLGVGNEHIALLTDNGIVYYQSRHIKGIAKQQNKYTSNSNLDDLDYEIVKVNGFKDVVTAFRHKWVNLNGNKKDSIEGFISEVFDDHVIMINDGEVFYVPMFHIKSIAEAVKYEDNSDEGKNQNNNENRNKNRSRKNQKENDSQQHDENHDQLEEEQTASTKKDKILFKNSQVFSAYKDQND